MENKLRLALAGTVVLVVVATTGTTRALWHEEASIKPGTVTTGNLELLAEGQPETYLFDALSQANLAPGDVSSAPLTITNGGSTDLVYQLEAVTTGSTNATTPATADIDLASALTLSVTDDAICDGTEPHSGVKTLYQGPLSTAAFAGSRLAPSSSEELCVTVGLPDTAPIAASTGAVSATFIFRGDQVQ